VMAEIGALLAFKRTIKNNDKVGLLFLQTR